MFVHFVYLGFIVSLENFHLYRNVSIAGEGLQIRTYFRQSWPLSSESSLAGHTTATWGIRLRWSSQMTRDFHTYCRAFSNGAVTTCFYDVGPSRLGFEHPTFRLRDQRFNRLRHRRGRI